jgi:hypothetical protein
MELHGNQSCPVEPGQQPEASLAWGEATLTAKRSGQIKRYAIEPRKLVYRDEPSFLSGAGPRQALATLGPARVPGLTGVGEHGE